MSDDHVTLTIDDVEVKVPKGTSVFEAAKSVGISIPHFCYLKELTIAGVCRMCLVEVEKMPKLVTSCSTVAGDGMVVRTPHTSEKVRKAVEEVLELHFINHPTDCPICDQAGECKLQDYYYEWGLYTSRFKERKVANPKHRVIGPTVTLDADRCILCSRCVRFCREIPKTEELCIINRGDHAEIALGTGKRLENPYSANVVDICPVGAHTLTDFRFKCRSWYLTKTNSVCPGCARGCSITVDHHEGRVHRIKPRQNDSVNERWLCDHGRFLYETLYHSDRLEAPMVRAGSMIAQATWGEALNVTTKLLQAAAKGVVGLGSPHATNEENYLLGRLIETLGSKSLAVGTVWDEQGEEDDILKRADMSPNRTGAGRILGESTLGDVLEGAEVVLSLAHDPVKDASEQVASALGEKVKVIALSTHLNETARAAAVVLPIAAFAERAGTVTNFEGQTQAMDAAVSPPGQARPAVEILADLIEALGGKPLKKRAPADLFDELAKKVTGFKGLKHAKLGDEGAGKQEEVSK